MTTQKFRIVLKVPLGEFARRGRICHGRQDDVAVAFETFRGPAESVAVVCDRSQEDVDIFFKAFVDELVGFSGLRNGRPDNFSVPLELHVGVLDDQPAFCSA